MYKKTSLVLNIGLIALFAVAIEACSSNSKNSATQSSSSSITNGTLAADDSPTAKAVVLLDMESETGDTYLCSGTLIAQDVILTAAHCLVDDGGPTPKLYKNISAYQTLHQPSQMIEAEKTIPHPLYVEYEKSLKDLQYKGNFFDDYDIGLIKLKSAFPSEYAPAKIMTDFEQAFAQTARIAGYGRATMPLWEFDWPLTAGPMTLSHDSIQVNPSVLRASNKPYATKINFTSQPQSASICHGDSGGPIFFEKDGKLTLIGVDVSMKLPKDSQELCASSGQIQTATLLSGEILEFVRNAYSEITGRNASEVTPEIKNDPNVPENHFGDTTLPAKNSWVDLTKFNQAIILPGSNSTNVNLLLLESKSPTEDLCVVDHYGERNGYRALIHDRNLTTRKNYQTYLGAISLKEYEISITQKYFYAYVGLDGNSVELIVITPDGLVRASIPQASCSS